MTPPSTLEGNAGRVAAAIEKHPYLVLCLLTVVYLCGAVLHAASRPFWYDEVITLIVAKSPDLATTWKAALECDANPPLPHLLTHLSIGWFGVGEISARAPAIVGFWVFCLCLYRFVRRRTGIYYALSALLLPVVTEAYNYSAEARAYGLELASCGLALVAWQAAAENSKRFLALAGLAASVAAALLCHYYAVLLYLPLAGGEAFREYRARKIDWGVWLALAAGGAPVVWRLSTILHVVKGFTSWSPPYLRQSLEFWETGLQHALGFGTLLAALLALSMVLNRKRLDGDRGAPLCAPDHELVAGALFLAIPLAAIVGALLVTHMFTARYALTALAGFSFLTPMLAADVFGGRALPGSLLALVLATGLGLTLIDVPQSRNPFEDEPILREALGTGPVVIPDGQLFLQMWHYAPEPLKPRLLFLADNDAAKKYMGFDTIDGGVLVLRPWSSVNAIDYRSFAAPGREFFVYQNTLRPGWLLPRVLEDGASVEVRNYKAYRALVRVRLKG